MKIGLIGPGILPIPPTGWGAVEILIWDYYQALQKKQFHVEIINLMRSSEKEQRDLRSDYMQTLIKTINERNFDFVHIHYDVFYSIISFLKVPHIGFTSHYPYISQRNHHSIDGFESIFEFMIHSEVPYLHFVLTQKDIDFLVQHGANPKRLFLLENGVDIHSFRFTEYPSKKDRTLYLGKIQPRKNQTKFQTIDSIDFVGEIHDSTFFLSQQYLGVWTREMVHHSLTDYGNLLLISQGEADPLVVKEALASGLGVVVNESSAKNLNMNHNFIHILNDHESFDLDKLKQILKLNRDTSLLQRNVIRNYAINSFSWDILIDRYINSIIHTF